MDALTPAERRGALLVALLLALGAVHDLWRLSRPAPAMPPGAEGVAAPPGSWPRDPDPAGSAERGREGRGGAPWPEATRLDLNRASARELESLPGVGPVLAGRIIAHRERHGPFRRCEDLLGVRGIGPRLLARLRPHVAVGPSGPPPAPADPPAGPRGG